MSIVVGQTVTIEGHRCPYRVDGVYGAEDGTLMLKLMPTEPPFLQTLLEGVFVAGDGTLFTRQGEEVEAKQDAVVVVESEEPATAGAEQMELF